jgi:lipoate-protein ligase A
MSGMGGMSGTAAGDQVGSRTAHAAMPRLPHLRWTFIVEPAGRPGADNMALDQWLLEHADRGAEHHAWLRLYRWNPPCLSFGRNEPALSRYDRGLIERLGLDVVRRPTGGRAVWHEQELTYAVVAPVATFGSLRESYLAIHQRLAEALHALGTTATLAPPVRGPPTPDAAACFAHPVGGEVLIDGRKVVGSAQVRLGHTFLQHGSVLLAGSQEVVRRVSRTPEAAIAATSLEAALGRPVEFDEVAAAIVSAWSTNGAVIRTAEPPARRSKFHDGGWTWRR